MVGIVTKEFFERGKQIAKWADANMTKDTALKMVIEAMEDLCEAFMLGADWRGVGVYDNTVDALQACKEALEQPAQKSYEQSWYDTHPAPSWQGLSDDEIWNIANFLGKNKEWDYPVMFAKTIEQALKEKNNA